jgi:hypothetical protein
MDRYNRENKISMQGRFATKSLLYTFRKISQFELVPIHAMKTHEGVEVWFQSFLSWHQLEVQRV